ncbi:PAS and helix-turn-helix domain-containing protein [Cognatishimia sp. SS12]|uniref:PAS and helix-turn-helix domain-containing protein n=1 Tax=Cognatishimia sp. SS12 TaxID=2979465 RepID=UPI00232DDF5E|nr:PAS and helix-turn-helix domain-containing protein [Cognatishimia sp. SS12]MDC0736888.1 PAS and helix-turn-helix domain-containing protein [Cognatishimia sp. SS12]
MSDLAFKHAPIGICLLENRVIRSPNDAFAAMFQCDLAACKGRSIGDFYASEEDFATIGARVREAMETQGAYHDERIMRRLDGTLFWCRVRGKSLTPDQPFYCGVWTFADLSEERPVVQLTQREREVAILTCRGQTSKEIGLALDLSYRTVEEYRARLLKKFGARKLAELVAKLSGMPL